MPAAPLATRFWSKVEPEPMSGCWLWIGARHSGGYGEIRKDKKKCLTHRIAWALEHGEEPTLHVLHRCDTPACVNVRHLFLGTSSDNARDMWTKGRARPGQPKINARIAASIRRRYLSGDTQRALAKEFAMYPSSISGIVHGRSWKPKEPVVVITPRWKKLTMEEARTIRSECAKGASRKAIAAQYGIDPSHVGLIVRHVEWREPS